MNHDWSYAYDILPNSFNLGNIANMKCLGAKIMNKINLGESSPGKEIYLIL